VVIQDFDDSGDRNLLTMVLVMWFKWLAFLCLHKDHVGRSSHLACLYL